MRLLCGLGGCRDGGRCRWTETARAGATRPRFGLARRAEGFGQPMSSSAGPSINQHRWSAEKVAEVRLGAVVDEHGAGAVLFEADDVVPVHQVEAAGVGVVLRPAHPDG